MNSVCQFAWYLWIGGSALIVGSWFDVVSVKVGWIGFGVALAGTLLSMNGHRFRSGPRDRGPRILCDSCRLNVGHACWRPERPNATKCEDYDAM